VIHLISLTTRFKITHVYKKHTFIMFRLQHISGEVGEIHNIKLQNFFESLLLTRINKIRDNICWCGILLSLLYTLVWRIIFIYLFFSRKLINLLKTNIFSKRQLAWWVGWKSLTGWNRPAGHRLETPGIVCIQ